MFLLEANCLKIFSVLKYELKYLLIEEIFLLIHSIFVEVCTSSYNYGFHCL